jgi:two-component system, LytTR family, sensor kinase
MKSRCEKCSAVLRPEGDAYICSYECTFCSSCAAESQGSCPNCTGELVRRPSRAVAVAITGNSDIAAGRDSGTWLVWAVSFGVWTAVALAASVSVYELWRSRGYPMTVGSILGSEFSQVLTYAPLTPLVFALAMRFPIHKDNWARRSLLHLLFGIVFAVAHVILKGITPYAAWDPKLEHYISGIWNSQAHTFQIKWPIFQNLFLSDVVDDITSIYVPIVLVAHAVSYYRRFRDRELHSTMLEMQLAKSHLQTLKSHLQPHFLFNTLHSISSLMLTDVSAADRMMARLSDLLRMSLESSGLQVTTLSRELEFLNAYLEIEKVRFGDRLNVVLEVAPETLDAQVPSLFLQPLAENSIRHGIARMSSAGTVWITASHDGRDLVLQVRDNGPGLSEVADVPSRKGVGLGTTRERLRTLYGKEHSFEIRGVPSGGVEVCARIPFRIDPQLSANEMVFAENTVTNTA